VEGNPIYLNAGRGFGDIWASTSWLLRKSEELNEVVRVKAEFPHFRDWMAFISPIFDSVGRLKFVDRGIAVRPRYANIFKGLMPVKKRWEPRPKKVVYQLDGRHNAHLKNLSSDQTRFLLSSLRRMGYSNFNVGNMTPIRQVVRHMSEAAFFVGVPSGMSVVALSVGLPVYIVLNKMPRWHVNWIYKGYNAKIFQLPRYLIKYLKEERKKE